MNTKLIHILSALVILGTVSLNVHAGSTNEALTACKSHIAGLYQDDLLRSSLKKSRRHSKYVEIKMKVMVKGETFKATCKISGNGDLSYSTNSESNLISQGPK